MIGLPKRIASKIEPEPNSGCWLWAAAQTGAGYGGVWLNGRMELAHRALYMAIVGSIPTEMTLDHKCRNRSCVNPDHLEVVTRGENVLRGVGITAQNAKKTHCLHGHRFTHLDANGSRACRTCLNAASVRYNALGRNNARKLAFIGPRRPLGWNQHVGKVR